MANFVSNENAIELMNGIAAKFNSLGGAWKFRGSVTFANLPSTITPAMAGYLYNLTDDFTTDARFIEGAGKKYKAGTNVAVADLTTYSEVTPVTKYAPPNTFSLSDSAVELEDAGSGFSYVEVASDGKLNTGLVGSSSGIKLDSSGTGFYTHSSGSPKLKGEYVAVGGEAKLKGTYSEVSGGSSLKGSYVEVGSKKKK